MGDIYSVTLSKIGVQHADDMKTESNISVGCAQSTYTLHDFCCREQKNNTSYFTELCIST